MLKSLKRKLMHNPTFMMSVFNLYRPFRGAGIKIKHIQPDFRRIEVHMPLERTNKNIMGTHFGGSLYAMADPFYMFMLMKNLGARYHVWDQSAHIEFVRPGDGLVKGVFELKPDQLQDIIEQAASGDKVLYTFECPITKLDGTVVAKVTKVLYVRLKKAHRPSFNLQSETLHAQS